MLEAQQHARVLHQPADQGSRHVRCKEPVRSGHPAERRGEDHPGEDDRCEHQGTGTHDLRHRAETEERLQRNQQAHADGEEQTDVVRFQPLRFHDTGESVAHHRHQQDGSEHVRVHVPGAAEQQRHLHHGLGFDKHEARTQEQGPQVQTRLGHGGAGIGVGLAFRAEVVDRPQHNRQAEHEGHAAPGECRDTRLAHVQERPVVVGGPEVPFRILDAGAAQRQPCGALHHFNVDQVADVLGRPVGLRGGGGAEAAGQLLAHAGSARYPEGRAIREELSQWGNRLFRSADEHTATTERELAFQWKGRTFGMRRVDQHHGFRVELFVQHFLEPGHDPALAEEVVHRGHARGLQHPFHIGKRFRTEQEAFQADTAVARVQHQRIDQCEDHEVVRSALGFAEEVASIVEVAHDARIVVGAVRVVLLPELLDDRVDVDGIDDGVRPAPVERPGQVVARSGTDHEDALELRPGFHFTLEKVRQVVRGLCRHAEFEHPLMPDQVRGEGLRVWVEIDPVVRTPSGLARSLILFGKDAVERSRHRHHQHQHQGGDWQKRAYRLLGRTVAVQEIHEADGRHRQPQRRRQLELRTGCERGDTEQATEQVGRVAVRAVGHPVESPAHLLTRAHQNRPHQQVEDSGNHFHRHRELQFPGYPGFGAEEHHFALAAFTHDGHLGELVLVRFQERSGRDGQQQQVGREGNVVRRATGQQAAHRHSDETRQQHGVREERQKHHMCGEPADTDKFEKQHQGTDQEKVPCGSGSNHAGLGREVGAHQLEYGTGSASGRWKNQSGTESCKPRLAPGWR